MPSRRLDGKVAIVTGAASGFGGGIAEKLSQGGAKVIIADLSQEVGKSTASASGGLFVEADVTKASEWGSLLATSLKAFGQLDIVINNAEATYPNNATEDVTEPHFDIVFNVNVQFVFISTNLLLERYFLEEKRPGCFIQVASTAGIRPHPRLTWYHASKGALTTTTKSLPVKYGPTSDSFQCCFPRRW